jgi:hypothetical protein
VSVSPAAAGRQRSQEELLSIAKQLPEPVLSDARREEMRTAFLATVKGVRSTTLVRSRRMHGKGKRLLLILIILFAGAGFAAAAWRIKTHAIRAESQSDRAASTERRPDRSGQPQIAEASPLALERGPTGLREVELPPTINHRRVSHQPAHRVAIVRGADPTPNVEMAFAQGWSALRTGAFEVAAEAFGRAASQPEKSALSEDASFWEAVALDRDQRWTDAQKAFTHFLTRYPESDRTGEAAVMLGWLLLRAGDVRAAEVRFESALGDPVERVRRSAQAGLEASGRHPN